MKILKETKKILKARGKEYPPYIIEAKITAKIWSAILGFKVPYRKVPLMMAGLKLGREAVKPKEDNRKDGIGYLVRAHEIAKK